MLTPVRLLSKATFAILVACTALFAGTIASDLNALSGNTVVQVIVGLNPSQMPAPANMIGAVSIATLTAPNAIVLQTTAATAINLGSDPAVNHVSIDHVAVGSGTL